MKKFNVLKQKENKVFRVAVNDSSNVNPLGEANTCPNYINFDDS
jgi:hypothetical protein